MNYCKDIGQVELIRNLNRQHKQSKLKNIVGGLLLVSLIGVSVYELVLKPIHRQSRPLYVGMDYRDSLDTLAGTENVEASDSEFYNDFYHAKAQEEIENGAYQRIGPVR